VPASVNVLRLAAAGTIASLVVAGCTSSRQAALELSTNPPPTSAASSPATPSPTAPHSTATHKPRTTPPPPPPRSPRSTTRHTTAPPRPRTSSASSVPAGNPLPLRFDTGSARQVVTVVAPSTGSTTATLQAWSKTSSGWRPYTGALTAHVGSQGLTGQPSESKSATPIGSFGLTQAFGSASNPGTALPYFRTSASDWWVSDASSRYYNTHYQCASSCPFNTGAGENLHAAGFVYTYAVVIDYNRFPVTPGAGSAFFLHVTDGGSTAGCVSIPEASLVSIMRWLDPSAHPRILIGVG
jgi:L,D-peptidoglycan transpeptidase YkuD (ErfK/YbiS/YcfS/YnhG family)